MENTGKVWLVGAGPGDGGLLTLKGFQVLKSADVVIYDALAGDQVVEMIPDHARQIYVGKQSGNHTMSQEEINALLLDEGQKGLSVVRLKGGDPFVFGRGSEELALLAEHHIPFEVVPGVTSAVAVAAYCGIPVTHRGLSSSFHVITGHGKNGEPVDIDYEALVRIKGTLIFLMGVASMEAICRGLLAGGMTPSMPVVIMEQGTLAGQKKVLATLSTICEEAKKANIQSPAIILVGQVCSLEPVCRWAEKRPLHGAKILVTRPRHLASRLSEKLKEQGAQVWECPTISTTLAQGDHLGQVLKNIGKFSWLVLTSPSGVRLLFEYMEKEQIDIRALACVKLAVIGPGTERELKKRQIYPDYMPESYYAKDLGEGLASVVKKEERVLIMRARDGSKELSDAFCRAGISFEDVVLYETEYEKQSPGPKRANAYMEQGSFDYITFTSASTVTGFLKAFSPTREALLKIKGICIGTQTEKMAKQAGMSVITSRVPTMDSMVELMIEDWEKGQKDNGINS